MLPVLLQFHFPEFLGHFHWIEGLVWAVLVFGLYLWRSRKAHFSINGFAFWMGMLASIGVAALAIAWRLARTSRSDTPSP